MALSAPAYQYIAQLGLLTFVDPSKGPKGPQGTVAYKLVPTSCWIGSQPLPRDVKLELEAEKCKTYTLEGVEYWMLPEEGSTNLPGELSHYAQTTLPSDLVNPPGGGVNRASETFVGKNAGDATVDPEAVSKYVKSADNREEAQKTEDAKNARISRQVGQ
jgi:hypothetical protein